MNKRLLNIVWCILVLYSINVPAQNIGYVWAKSIGDTATPIFPKAIAVDAVGNVYTTGTFVGNSDFDPNTGEAFLTSDSLGGVFISKLDATGNFIWAKSISSVSYVSTSSITTDAKGNIYIAGTFEGTVDFNPNAGITNLTSAGNRDIFVAKLNTSGDLMWVKSMGGTGNEEANAIALDAAGNVYTIGYFRGTTDFDPNAGVANLITNGLEDVFVSKLDTTGNFVWAKNIGGTNTDRGYSIATDATGNIYITGTFQSIVDFDPNAGVSNLTSNGLPDIFVSKLNSSGNLVWAKSMGGSSLDIANDIAIDAAGNVYTTGRFRSSVDFDPNAGVATILSAGGNDIFISKLDANGNYLWAKTFGGPTNQGNDEATSIALDAAGNVYTTGRFAGFVDFDPNAGVANLSNFEITTDIFISKLDAAGNYVSAKRIGGLEDDVATALVLDASNNILITGNFRGTVDFDPDAGIVDLLGNAMFIGKYGLPCPAITFVNTTAARGTVGTPFTLNASATTGSGTLAYTVSPALPAGLSINANTGQITGTPTTVTTSTTYTVTATQGACSATQRYTFEVARSTSIADNALSERVKVSPNPSTGHFTINFDGIKAKKTQLKVYNAQGRQILIREINQNSIIDISLEQFANGIYFLDVQTSEGKIVKKLVKL